MNAVSRTGKPLAARIRLGINELTVVPGRRGTSIRCRHGRVWVTREGDARDYILLPGLQFVAADAGRIVIHGMEDDNTIEIGVAQAPGARAFVYQPLRIDWEQVARIEHAARRARAECFAAALRAMFNATTRALRRMPGWTSRATSTASTRKSGGSA